MFLNCSDGSFDRPTAILSSQDCFEFYNARLLQVARYIDPYKTGDLSFTALEYQGMPWYQDRQCPSGRMYMLNTRHVHFFIDPSMFLEVIAEADLADQLLNIYLLTLKLTLVYKSRMFLGVLDGFTA